MTTTPGYRVEAMRTDRWARQHADAIDNAFGNLLRGNSLEGFVLVLRQDDEIVDHRRFVGELSVEDAVEEFLAATELDRGDVADWDLDL